MEIKTYFAQDPVGEIIPNPTVTVYLADTLTLATIFTKAGSALANPFTGTATGLIEFGAADGEYDMKVDSPSRTFTIRVQCNDTTILSADVEHIDLASNPTTVSAELLDLEDRVNVAEPKITTLQSQVVRYAVTNSAGTALAASLPDGATVIVDKDETWTPTGVRVRYTVASGELTGGVADDASQAKFTQAGTGAVARAAQNKMREFVSVKDFGAVGDGVADDTAALKKAFDYAIPLALPVELEGSYLVTGPIQPATLRASGSVHIVCKGHVSVVVKPSATAFRDLFYLETTAYNNCSIIGGSLSIDCSNKVASCITFRHGATTRSGTVNIECQIEILNCFNNDASATYENQALLVFGDYQAVTISRPRVIGVSRTASTGACKGISVAAFTGEVVINQPYVSTVLIGAGNTDADGIATFSKNTGTTYSARTGRVVINEPVFIDCQGRSYKSQCSDSTVNRPKVFRKNAVAITQAVEFDFQAGNGFVFEPEYEFRLNGATSPIGASHSCISFQQVLNDNAMRGKSIGGVLKTEVMLPRYVSAIYQTTASYSEIEVSGLRVIPLGSLSTTAIARAIVEINNMSYIVNKTEKTKIIVRDISGPVQCFGIGYSSYTSGSLATKLAIEVTNCFNTLGPSSSARPFHNLSGTAVTDPETFLFHNNYGFRDLFANGWTFSFNKLVPGCVFTVDIAGVTATGAPAWGASGYAVIECIGCWFSDTDKVIRVTTGNATAANTVFYTQNGGATWGTIK